MADKPTRTYGYWRSSKKEKSDLPWPISKPDSCISGFVQRADKVQRIGVATGKLQLNKYRGFSVSRLTGKSLGCEEYEFRGAKAIHRWPADYVSHYLAKAVPPDPAFVKLINMLFDKWSKNTTVPPKPAPKPGGLPLDMVLRTIKLNVKNRTLSDKQFRQTVKELLSTVQ